MIVDSYTLYAEALQQTLTKAGIEPVCVVGLSEAAVIEARANPPEVVLVDLAYADGKGIELGKRILEQLRGVRVLGMIAPRDVRHEREAAHAGFAGCITKDTSPARFVRTIRAALEHQKLRADHHGNVVGLDRASENRKFDSLTPREREVLSYLVIGVHTGAIAKRMGVSNKTVRSHVYNILTKLQVHSRLAAATLAAREGLVPPASVSRSADTGA